MVLSSLLSTATSSSSLVDQVRFLILLLIVTLIVALLSRRLRVPYTLLLVIVGFVVGLLPFLPNQHIDPNLVLYIFIPALLFEGAWNAEINRLEADWLPIVLLAIPGLVLSLLAVAAALSWGIGLPWLLALLVGAIVSPTDPVAVIALFQQLGVPDRLRTLVEGESIFNDGTGSAAYELVLAVLLPTLGLAEVSGNPSFLNTPALGIAGEVLWLIFGGLLLGFGVGWVASRLLRRVDDHLIVITVTVAVAYGMYLLGWEPGWSWAVTDASMPCLLAPSKQLTTSGSSSTISPIPCSSSCWVLNWPRPIWCNRSRASSLACLGPLSAAC